MPYLDDSNNLGVLMLDNNNLTKLPYLTKTIYYLCCSNNKLREMPPLPNSLIHLYCENNDISVLPFINDKENGCLLKSLQDLNHLLYNTENETNLNKSKSIPSSILELPRDDDEIK